MLFAIREGWASSRRGRLLAQAAFAVLLVSGTYIVSTGGGKVADRVVPESTQALKGDRQPVLREAMPEPALPEPATRELAALAEPAPAVVPVAVPPPKPAEAAKPRKALALPTGVERFDSCRAPCDSRDPLVRRAEAPAKLAALGELAPSQAAVPQAALPQAQASAPASASEPASVGLLPDGGQLLAATVSGTQAAFGKMRQAMQTVVDVVW